MQRDCYDLDWDAEQILDESLIRRLWFLKVLGDVVQDGRGSKPLDPAVITTELDADEQHWARCDPRDAYAVQSALTAFQNT